jgi:rare lipoprotein A
MRASWDTIRLAISIAAISACAFAPIASANATTCGQASYYTEGARTANGERYRPDGMTAAHRTLAFGTILRVSYSGRTVSVRVNDRGPFIHGRILDLSRGSAKRLGMIGAGIARVCFTICRNWNFDQGECNALD